MYNIHSFIQSYDWHRFMVAATLLAVWSIELKHSSEGGEGGWGWGGGVIEFRWDCKKSRLNRFSSYICMSKLDKPYTGPEKWEFAFRFVMSRRVVFSCSFLETNHKKCSSFNNYSYPKQKLMLFRTNSTSTHSPPRMLTCWFHNAHPYQKGEISFFIIALWFHSLQLQNMSLKSLSI